METENKTKKRRGCNYTPCEKEMLIDIVKGHDIVENKDTTGEIIRKKKHAWSIIALEYNASATSGPRTWEQLRHLYENIKQRTKKKVAIKKENTQEFCKKEIEDTSSQDTSCMASYIYTAAFCDENDVKFTRNQNGTETKILTLTAEPDNVENTDDSMERIPVKPTLNTKSLGKKKVTNSLKNGNENVKKKKCSVKEQYFKIKLGNAKLERKFLVQRHQLEIQLLKIKINKLGDPFSTNC